MEPDQVRELPVALRDGKDGRVAGAGDGAASGESPFLGGKGVFDRAGTYLLIPDRHLPEGVHGRPEEHHAAPGLTAEIQVTVLLRKIRRTVPG